MSLDIWTQCGGKSEIRPLSVRVLRCVEDQHRSSTLDLVDSADEHEILENFIEKWKPAPHRMTTSGMDYLLATPFRYPPLKWGSRFGSVTEPSLFYGAIEGDTALGETAYYQMSFLRAAHTTFETQTKKFCVFGVDVETQAGVDLTDDWFSEFTEAMRSPLDYSATRLLGARMRAAGVEAFLYWSARCPGGTNAGVFTPEAFASKLVPDADKHVWTANISAGRVIFQRYRGPSLTFVAADFFVNGNWPAIPT